MGCAQKVIYNLCCLSCVNCPVGKRRMYIEIVMPVDLSTHLSILLCVSSQVSLVVFDEI